MSELKKIVGVVLGGVAVLFFLSTNVLLPIVRDNKEQAAKYAQLKGDVEMIERYTKQKLDVSEKSLNDAIGAIGQHFLPEGKVQLTEQFTEVPVDSDVVFSNIAYRKSMLSNAYEIFSVDISAQAPFHDLIAYLTHLESGEMLVGIQSISLHNVAPGATSLEARIAFVGFRLIDKPPASSQYLEQQYQPFDESRLESLLKQPIKVARNIDSAFAMEEFDPFFSAYDFNKRQKSATPKADNVMIPAGTPTFGIQDLKLKGILRLHNTKVALINDRIVKEGEQISGAEVVKIEDFRVTLKFAGEEYILKIGAEGGFTQQ